MRSTPFHWLQKPALGARQDPGHPLARGCIGRWLLNEGTGGAYDCSGQGVSVTRNSGATWGTAKYGAGIVSNGTNPLTTAPIVPPTTGLSFMQWFRGSNLSGARGLFGLTSGTGKWCYCECDEVVLYGSDGVTNIVAGLVVPSNSVWHQIVCTWDGRAAANALAVYVDGVLDSSGNSMTGTYSGPQTAAIGFGIGGATAGTPALLTVDNAGMWNRALSVPEIQRLYSEPFWDIQPPQVRRFFFAPTIFTALTSGGMKLGGTIGTPGVTYTPATSGGTVLGGTVGAPAIGFTALTSGGAELGGTSAAPSVTYTATTSGGLELGGVTLPSVVFVASTAGGLKLGGVNQGAQSFMAVEFVSVEVADDSSDWSAAEYVSVQIPPESL